MAIGAASELVFIIDGHVVNSTRINLKSSPVYGILFFNSAVKLREKPWRLTERFHIFTL